MSDYNSTATSTIYVNGKPAEAELQKLKQRASDLKDAIAAAAKAGDKADLRKLRGELTSTKREVKNVENAIHSCEVVMKRLDKATPKELNMALKQLKRELNDMERGTAAWDKQVAKIKRVKAELESVNAEMKEHQGVLSRLNDGINKWGMSIASAAAALTGITMTVRQAVEAYAQMDQEMASVRKYTGMTDEEVKSLNEDFKKMDTRTSRENLNKLAQDAGRLGKHSRDDVLGFVRAADQINVALDDLGDGATLTLSKIAGAFGEEERYGTEQALLKTGSVINELSQNCRASAPYLADFTQRLTGAGTTAHMTIPQLMAFGAVLDSYGAQLESSATALGQVIIKLYRDPAKYAEAAGMDVKNFTELLKTDANEAVLTFLQSLHDAGNLDVLAPMLADMGEKGARSVQTLTTLAGKIDDVRAQQKAANTAFEEGTSVSKEAAIQNSTIQAQLEKAKKGFNDMAVALGEKLAPAAKYAITGTSALMKVLSGTINFIVNNKTAIVSLTAAIAAYTVATNFAAIKTGILTAAQKVATAATKLFNLALSANPAGLVAAAVTGLATALVMMSKNTDEATEAQKALNSVQADAQAKAVEQRLEIENLIAAAGDFTLGLDNQRRALNQLNRIIPGFNGKIDAQAKKFTYAKGALDDYLNSLIHLYEIEGAKKLLMEIGEKKARIAADNAVIVEETKDLIKQGQSGVRSSDNAGKYLVNNIKYEENNKELKKLDAQEQAVKKKYGKDIVKNTVSPKQPKSPQADGGITGGNGVRSRGGSGHSGGRSGGGSRKRTSGSTSSSGRKRGGRRRSGGGSKATTKKTGSRRSGSTGSTKKDDKFAADKQWLKEQQDVARLMYERGLFTEDEYNAYLAELQQEYYDKQFAHANLTQAEKFEIHANKLESYNKEQDRVRQKSIHDEDNSYREAVGNLTQEYIDGKISIEKLNEESEKLELQHLERMVDLTKEGSDERLAAEEAYRNKKLEITNRKNEEEKQLQQEFEDAWKERQKELEDLRHEYFGLSDDEKQKAYDNAISTLDYIYQSELKKLGDNHKAKLELERKYAKAKKKIHDGIFKEEQDAGDQQMRNWEQWVEKWLDKIFGQGTWEEYGGFVKSAWSSLMSGYQSFTKLVEAEEKEKLAAMTKKYDAELKAAEGNQYRINQINKRKAAEEKRIKDAANKRAMAMEMAQAIASTALAAINAYKTAPAPVMIFGPIAAGLALAAGAVQIAAIKKQHDAQSAGYAEGGFTKPGAKHEPAGIVHAGEWVASQRLLASPVARPMIDALDYAQRTNTIGRLRAGGMAGSPVVVTESDELRATIARLNKRLDEPFVTVNTVTGDNGIKKAMDDYNKLQNNTLPKNKRT